MTEAELIALLRQARGSVDQHRKKLVSRMAQAYRKGDDRALDRYGKTLENVKKLIERIDSLEGKE